MTTVLFSFHECPYCFSQTAGFPVRSCLAVIFFLIDSETGIDQFVAITLVPWHFMVDAPCSHAIMSSDPFLYPRPIDNSPGLGAPPNEEIKVPLGFNQGPSRADFVECCNLVMIMKTIRLPHLSWRTCMLLASL